MLVSYEKFKGLTSKCLFLFHKIPSECLWPLVHGPREIPFYGLVASVYLEFSLVGRWGNRAEACMESFCGLDLEVIDDTCTELKINLEK